MRFPIRHQCLICPAAVTNQKIALRSCLLVKHSNDQNPGPGGHEPPILAPHLTNGGKTCRHAVDNCAKSVKTECAAAGRRELYRSREAAPEIGIDWCEIGSAADGCQVIDRPVELFRVGQVGPNVAMHPGNPDASARQHRGHTGDLVHRHAKLSGELWFVRVALVWQVTTDTNAPGVGSGQVRQRSCFNLRIQVNRQAVQSVSLNPCMFGDPVYDDVVRSEPKLTHEYELGLADNLYTKPQAPPEGECLGQGMGLNRVKMPNGYLPSWPVEFCEGVRQWGSREDEARG